MTESLPQRPDYQRAMYESLCRIEGLLRETARPDRITAFSGTLTMDETAGALRVSRSTVKQMIGRGTIRAVRIGRRVVIPREALDQLVEDKH